MKFCWMFQKAICLAVDHDSKLSPWVERHVHHCPGCQRVQKAHRQVAAVLSAAAERHRLEPSPFLHARIMANLDNSGRQLPLRFGMVSWARPLFLMGLSVVLILGILIWHEFRTVSPYALTSLDSQTEEPQAQLNASQLLALTDALEQPLEKEFNLMMKDAKAAAASLAANFLPREMLAKAEPSD